METDPDIPVNLKAAIDTAKYAKHAKERAFWKALPFTHWVKRFQHYKFGLGLIFRVVRGVRGSSNCGFRVKGFRRQKTCAADWLIALIPNGSPDRRKGISPGQVRQNGCLTHDFMPHKRG
jgi:hypothetical protein